jgi:transposase
LVPVGHPVRQIRRQVDEVLGRLSPLFDEMYAQGGRTSIPPERLFCEQLRYNLLFRWFLWMDLTEEPFVAGTMSKDQERLLAHDVA